MLDNRGFDIWSKSYEESIEKSSNEYPFDGYYDVLNYVNNLIINKQCKSILDIGIGTGLLTNKLYEAGAKIYGVDFSEEMIRIAKRKMSGGIFIQWDFNLNIPKEVKDNKFDYIISSYAFHHLSDDKKVNLISELRSLLNENGKIIIADISFKTEKDLIRCRNLYRDKWDYDEAYMVKESIIPKFFNRGIPSRYTQISSCSGILEIC